MEIKDEIIALKNYESFLKIMDGKRPHYGGNQNWFKDEVYRKVGCATVVASNITAFLSKTTDAKKLYSYEGFSKKEFLLHMDDVIEFVCPNEEFGIPSAMYFMDEVIRFANHRGIKLEEHWITNLSSYDDLCNLIKKALKNNIPVALLMFRNEKLTEFDWHWMTITKYYKNESKTYITVSTWGEMKLINLEDFYNYSAYGALVYFTVV